MSHTSISRTHCLLDAGVPLSVDNLRRGVGVQMLSCHLPLERGVEVGVWNELRMQSLWSVGEWAGGAGRRVQVPSLRLT